MRNFLLFCLALVLVLTGTMALGYLPKGLTAPPSVATERVANLTSVESTDSNAVIEKVPNMISGELNNSNAVEVDGICFENLVPELVLTVPTFEPETNIPIEFGIRITNNTFIPWRFNFYTAINPELVRADGQVVQSGLLRIRRRKPKETHFPLVMPGESATFFPDARLLWNHNQLKLSIAKPSGGRCNFDVFNTGTYQFRFTYKNEIATKTIQSQYPEWLDTKLLEGFWTGVVFTPFVEFRLI